MSGCTELKQGKDATVYDAIATSKGWTCLKPVLMVVFLLVSFAFLVGDSYNPFYISVLGGIDH